MTRLQAIHCCEKLLTVEDRYDEDHRTGFITSVSPYTDHAAVSWDDNSDGETSTHTLRDLVVQYPEDLEGEAA